MTGLTSLLVSVLGVFAVALLVRLVVRNRNRLSFASVLVFVGVVVSALGLSFDLDLTSELILLVLLPAIIFKELAKFTAWVDEEADAVFVDAAEIAELTGVEYAGVGSADRA